MKTTKTFFTFVLVLTLVTPIYAQNNFVENFLRRYQPSSEPAASAPREPVPISNETLMQDRPLPMTLNDLIALMLENNLDVRTNRFSPYSSYLSGRVLYRTFQPNLRIASSMNKSATLAQNQLVGAEINRQTRNTYQVGISQTLPWGTDLSVDTSLTRIFSENSFNNYNPSYNANIQYSLVQSILRDRGREVNMRPIKISQNNQKISEIQFETQMINLLVQAQRSYWDLVFAGEDLKVKQRSLELATRTIGENKMKVDIGTLAPIDVVQTEAEVATRREQSLLSTFTVAQTEDQIKKLITNQSDPGFVLAKLQPADSPNRVLSREIPSVQDAIRIALENRPEIRQIQLELQNRTIDEKYFKNQTLPNLDLTASYSHNGLGGTRYVRGSGLGSAATTVIPGGVTQAISRLFGYDYTGYNIGFVLNIPLSNDAAEADHARTVNEKRLTESRLEATAQQIALEVRNALMQVELNRARIETAQTTHTLAERRHEAEQTKFQLGTSTLRFVLEEQRNVAQAQTNELQAMTNFAKALVDLDRAMGMTLRRNNVEIEKAIQLPIAAK
ncbi:MAG: TolC family protein [Acidobacteria bacterium]|nr:TolC family protein [Acidobacteriota bacterium]